MASGRSTFPIRLSTRSRSTWAASASPSQRRPLRRPSLLGRFGKKLHKLLANIRYMQRDDQQVSKISVVVFCFAKFQQVHPSEVYTVENHLRNIKADDSAVVQIQPDGNASPPERRRHRSSTRSRQGDGGNSMNSVSKIDQVSRVFFPALFLAINLFYWYTYTTPSPE